MAQIIQCFEPQARPSQINLAVEPGDEFSIYALQDIGETARGLRSTILRKSTEPPPRSAVFIFEVAVQAVGERTTLRVRRVNSKVAVELIRPDLRSRVSANTEIKSGSRFEAILPDMRTVNFGMQLEAGLGHSAKGSVGGGGGSKAKALASLASSMWLVPTAMAIFSSPKARVVAALQRFAKRLGISPGVLMIFLGVLVPVVVSLVYGYLRGRAADLAEEKAAEAAEDLQTAEAALDAALMAEANCVALRRDLVDELNDIDAKRELQAEIALAIPLAQTVSIEIGGPRMGNEDTMALDAQYLTNLKELVIGEMQKIRGTPKEAVRCLAQEVALGQDLPPYTLLYHPDPKLVCPLGYATVEGGVDRMGSWGLSTRAASAFGASHPAQGGGATSGDLADLRINDRWSAHTLATGVRAILTAMLTAETENRPPTAPGQSHVWALALWDAFNRLPTPADGVMNLSAEECVDALILEMADSSETAVPGQPVLPDISLVALEELVIAAKPTAGCPWPSDALTLGAKTAVKSVAHMAKMEGGAPPEG